ncbi:MAG: hypothetical protein HQL32_13125 [Planctomycetes bacterium]|nr:hypothetical protein [Planctomycetota bacterium]
MKLLIFLSIALLGYDSLFAEVIVQKRVNSWDQPGYLMVVITMILVFLLAALATLLEKKRKGK